MIQKAKHIILVTSEFPPQPGGIGNHAYNLAKHLSSNNYRISVISDQRSLDGSEEKQFDSKLNFFIHRVKLKRFRFLMYLERFYKLLSLIKSADVVIASGKFSLWTVAFCSLFINRKYISVVHGTEVNFKKRLLRKSIEMSLKRFDSIVAVSEYTKALISYLDLNVKVIPNGYDSNKWSSGISPLDTMLGNPKITTVGNVSSRKGQLNVISHLPILKLKYPKIHYHCIGLLTEAKKFKLIAKDLNVDEHITFHGRISTQEMQRLLMATDTFVMLSDETMTGDVEGFGIAVIEANALGIPAIGAVGTGLEDAINNNYSGILIDVKSTKQFEVALESILSNKSKFSEQAIAWSSQFEWNKIIHRYIDVIETI